LIARELLGIYDSVREGQGEGELRGGTAPSRKNEGRKKRGLETFHAKSVHTRGKQKRTVEQASVKDRNNRESNRTKARQMGYTGGG